MLRESASDVVAGSMDLKKLRLRRGVPPGYDPIHLRQMIDLGWLGILVPEPQGGLGLGLAEMAVVVQSLGKGLMADPLVPLSFAARVMRRASHGPGAAAKLVLMAEGRLLPAVAWQEGLGGIDVHQIQTRAETTSIGWRLIGQKRFIAGAAGAGGFIVSARSAEGCGLFWVDADAPGVTLSHEWRADQTPSGLLELNNTPVTAAQVITAPAHDGLAVLERAYDDTLVLASAEMLGVIEAALQMTLAYMRTRVQFDKPIGSFQALQHKAADLYVQQELVRAVLQDALGVLESSSDARETAQAASRCKARASDAGMRVLREVIQLHGAIGYTDEHDAGLYLKRAMVLSAWLGNASAHRARFAALQS